MIEITNSQDIEKLRNNPNIPSLCTDYIESVIHDLKSRYECEDISDYGRIILLESTTEHKEHKKLGLSQPLKQSLYEYSECIDISNSYEDLTLLHGCFLLSNEYFLSIYSEPKYLTKEEYQHLMSEAKEIKIW